jgi:hypothetical protein
VIGIGGAGLLVTGVLKLAIHSEAPTQVTSWDIAVTPNAVMAARTF